MAVIPSAPEETPGQRISGAGPALLGGVVDLWGTCKLQLTRAVLFLIYVKVTSWG